MGVDWTELKIRGIVRSSTNLDSSSGQSSFHRGAYADRMLRLGEGELYDEIIKNLKNEYGTTNETPSLHMELAAISSVKLIGAQTAGDWEQAERFDRMMQNHLKLLRAAKKKQESSPEQKTGDTPAERAAAIVEALRAEEMKNAPLQSKSNPVDDYVDL